MKLMRDESRLHASDLVLACENPPEIRCDWSVWISHNVSNMSNIPLAMLRSTSTTYFYQWPRS